MQQDNTIQPISFQKLVIEYKFQILALIINVVVFTALSIAIPNLTGEIIKSIESQKTNYNLTNILAIIVVLVVVVELFQVVISARFREKIGFDLRAKLMDKVTSLNYGSVNKVGIGQIITLFGSDVNNVKNIMAGELILSIKALMLFVGALGLIFVTNWKLGIIAFVSLPIIILAFGLIFKSVTKYFGLSQEIQTDLNNAISQNVYGSNLIRVQNSKLWETDKFNYLTNESKNISFKIIGAFSSLIPIINTVSNWTTFGILYFGALSYISGQILLGDINAYISYYALLTAPIFIIGFNSQGIARLGVSLKRINELLSSKEETQKGTHKSTIKRGFELKNVSLEYGGKQVLKDINFVISLNQKTAILGPTGAGKSLIINLLTGMIKPTTGQVLIDGIDIEEWDIDFIKKNITTVFQESLIFEGDLTSNIVLNRDFDQVKFDLAAMTSNIDELINQKSSVSELGSNLSGGQKQRLTLARALYNNPQIILLDDFVARVDKQTENKIQRNLEINYPNTTIVSVSQNIETIKSFDQIILLMEGELLATGNHQELLKNSPEYRQIEQSQRIID